MGDRANVAIEDRGKRVYLYTHWEGYRLPEIIHTALSKRWRWNDEAYLARIIFDELVGDQQGSETGFGISPHISDNQVGRPIIVIENQTIRLEGESGGEALRVESFEEFIKDPSVFYLAYQNQGTER